jgi:uncharacterized membrane protein HdeD (DUF308 family)
MGIIRYLTAIFFLLTGIVHVGSSLKKASDSHTVPMVIFGVIYFTIGALILFHVLYSSLLGIVFPASGIILGLLVIKLKNWTLLLKFLYAIDVVVILCCVLLVTKGTL